MNELLKIKQKIANETRRDETLYNHFWPIFCCIMLTSMSLYCCKKALAAGSPATGKEDTVGAEGLTTIGSSPPSGWWRTNVAPVLFKVWLTRRLHSSNSPFNKLCKFSLSASVNSLSFVTCKSIFSKPSRDETKEFLI